MATTTNYGWTTPDDTALVKDGASAIRTLGTSVDTTTKNLNPSTTLGDIEYRSSTSNTNTRLGIGSSGQNLQVVAGVPSWAASATSTLTTTGDLLYASAANTLARRAIGSTGNVLTVAGGVPTWAAPSGSSPAWTLLSTTATTSGSTIDITGLSGYNQFLIRFSSVSSNANADSYFLQFNSVTTGSKYVSMGETFNGAASFSTNFPAASAPAAGNSLDFAGAALASNTLSGYLFLQGGNGASLKVGHFVVGANDAAANSFHRWRGFVYDDTNVISSVQLGANFGSFDSGNIYIYGSVA